MAKKKKKGKEKKISAKKEKYAKFHKDKATQFTFKESDRTEDDVKTQRDDELKLNKFLRFNRNPPAIGPNDHKKRGLQKKLK